MADDASTSESSSVTVTRTEEGSQQLIVENYSLCKKFGVNKSIDSELFMVGGYLWEVRFFPGGKNDDIYNRGYASLYIALRSNISNSVPCLYEMHLLDQSGKGKHLCRNPFNCFPIVIAYPKFGRVCGIDDFIKRESLEPPSDYLKDDCLKINCNIWVLTSHIQKLCLNKFSEFNIGTDFGKKKLKKSDAVFFKVAGESFRAHKSILAAHSTVFRSYLLDSHQHYRQEIDIPDTKPRIFQALLWFIYTATLLEEEQEVSYNSSQFIFESFMGKMLAAADQFGLKRLKEIYELRFLEKVSVESVAYLLHLAEVCHGTELKDACLRFAAENRADVLESNGAEYLKEACPLLFLELAGYTKEPSTNREREFDFCTKIVTVVKESFDGMFSPYAFKKLKEV